MIRRIVFYLLLAIAALLLLASCKPVCDSAALVAPLLSSPSDRSVVASLNPTLEWIYPDDTCNPDGYRVTLSDITYTAADLGSDTGSMALSWVPATTLQPATMYVWSAAAMSDTAVGPDSDSHFFFTGPDCTPDTLTAPTIIYPVDGSTVTTESITIILEFSGCVPYEMRLDLTTDPTFTYGIAPFYLSPSTSWVTPHLLDCEWWYLRVENTDGSGGSATADTVAFFTNISGTCTEPDALASFDGIVWEDKCAVPEGTLPATIPAGCDLNAWGTGVWGDGIRQAGENGIRNVTVNLGEGLCPSTGLATTVTDADGYYAFHDLVPGWYCISINADENSALRKPGLWTRWMSGYEWTYSIHELHTGEAISEDFGWYPYYTGTKSSAQTCPEGYHYSAKINSCVPPCEGELLWNQYYQECQPAPVCSDYRDSETCEWHPPCNWFSTPNGEYCSK